MKNLPKKINICIKGVDKLSNMFDEAIAFDRKWRLVHDLLQSSTADENKNRGVEERLQTKQSSSKRKSYSKETLHPIPISL